MCERGRGREREREKEIDKKRKKDRVKEWGCNQDERQRKRNLKFIDSRI